MWRRNGWAFSGMPVSALQTRYGGDVSRACNMDKCSSTLVDCGSTHVKARDESDDSFACTAPVLVPISMLCASGAADERNTSGQACDGQACGACGCGDEMAGLSLECRFELLEPGTVESTVETCRVRALT